MKSTVGNEIHVICPEHGTSRIMLQLVSSRWRWRDDSERV